MKRKTIIGSGIVLIGMLASGLAASVAWFLAGENTFKTDVNGSVVEEYFHCGSGTQLDPFVITRPMHYYHLVEFFQRKTELPVSDSHNVTFGTDYLYFQIGYDLDEDPANGLEVYSYENDGTYSGTTSKILNMSYFSGDNALMPIGTSECPFFGSFDGGATNDAYAITVQNLNIKSQEDVIVEGGSSLTTRYTSDVGMFGYISDNDGDSHTTSIKNLYIDGLNIDLTGAVAGKDAVDAESVSHTSEHDSKIYVGYIVGHMHTYNRYDSAGPTDSSPIHDVYVNNATIEGGAEATCNFGYVGHADTINGVNGNEIDISDIINDLVTTASEHGQGNEWGGSINMLELNKRIYYFLNKNTERKDLTNIEYNSSKLTSLRYHRYFADNVNNKKTFAMSVYEAGTGSNANPWYNADPTNPPASRYPLIYRFEGKKDDAADATKGTGSIKLPGTYIPLLTDTQENGYVIDENNTGYIASANNYTTTTVRTASYKNILIGNSMSPFSTADNTNYDVNKLEVLSNSAVNYSASNYARIDNGIQSEGASIQTTYSASINPSTLPGYNKAYTKIKEVLSESRYVQGLHYTGNEINKNSTVTVPNAYLYGTEITDYPVLTSSVDFNASKNGSIKFFAGSYYNAVGTNADSFFSLHAVTRSGKNITNTYQIYDIYQNTNESTKTTYPNLYYDKDGNLIEIGYTSSTITKGSKLFDLRFLHNAPPMANAVYYFEIPVNQGEFALGSVEASKTKGAYLMYLDIGTSGSSEEELDYNGEHMISSDPIFTQIEYVSTGFVINSCFNIAYVVPAGATKETFAITVSRSGDVFNVIVVNTTENVFRLHVLLVDNDSDPDNDYPYTYTLKYNTGDVSTAYTGSNSYQGAASGTQLVPLLT